MEMTPYCVFLLSTLPVINVNLHYSLASKTYPKVCPNPNLKPLINVHYFKGETSPCKPFYDDKTNGFPI